MKSFHQVRCQYASIFEHAEYNNVLVCPSSCYPLAFQEALLQEDACIFSGVEVPASDGQAVITIGGEVRFFHQINVGWERHPVSIYSLADSLCLSRLASGLVGRFALCV
jgi:hypothetical protein